MQDIGHLESAIKKAREEADYVVVTMHAGKEYTREPTDLQRVFAHTAIE